MKKEDYDKFINYWTKENFQIFEEGKQLEGEIGVCQFSLTMILPKDLFIEITNYTIKRLAAIKNIQGYNQTIKNEGTINSPGLILANIESNLKEFDIDCLVKLLSSAFMTTPELIKIRLFQLYEINEFAIPIQKERNDYKKSK